MLRHSQRLFTYAALREATGFSQNSILKHLEVLEGKRWVRVERKSRYSVSVEPLWPLPSPAIRLPEDVLTDHTLPIGAKWVWGAIRRLGSSFNYAVLMELTGYSHNTLTKYLSLLQERRWLVGTACRVSRRKTFTFSTNNPPEETRQEALRALLRFKAVTEQWREYSTGQFIMARIIELLTGTDTMENGAPNFLHNYETGGRMQYDLYLTAFRIAFEFQGPQHKMITPHFPGEERLAAQQQRDELKRSLSQKAGITLIEVWGHQLSFEYLEGILRAHGVPIVPIADEQRCVYEMRTQMAETYRASALRSPA
jgi:hypothetical protein